MTGSAGLPGQARHEACLRLRTLGRYAEAGALLDPDDPADTELGLQTWLLAGDPAEARRFLPGLDRAPVSPGRRDLLRAAAEESAVLERGGRYLAGDEATIEDFAVFAVAAARLDLDRAGSAAKYAFVADQDLLAVVPVLAAAEAAQGEYARAFDLLEGASGEDASTDLVGTALTLLRETGHDAAAQAIVAFAVLVPDLPPERRRYWSALGRSVVVYSLGRRVLHLTWVGGAVAAMILLGPRSVLVWAGITGLWIRWVPLRGLDRRTTGLLRAHRLQRQRLTDLGFPDVVAFLLGALVGMVGFAFVGRNASDNAVSAFLIAGLAIGSISGAAGRRMLLRRMDARRQEAARLQISRDLRCRCAWLSQLTGPDSRYYVEWHLRAEGPGGPSWQVRRCGWSGLRFLDFPAISTVVPVRGLTDGWDAPGPTISPYL